MSEPTVCAIMLTKDRPAIAKRAVECFRAQTYQNKLIYALDTGAQPAHIWKDDESADWRPQWAGKTIGALRNEVISRVTADIIVHFDDDDWSHPNRIAEQVALLQASGRECVGYRDMLFWKTCSFAFCDSGRGNILPYCPECKIRYDPSRHLPAGDAWLYSNPDPRYCLGTSLCYWRKAWERQPFPDLPKAKGGTGEDSEWLKGVSSLGVCSIAPHGWVHEGIDTHPHYVEPRMFASIHGGNTQYYGADLLEASPSWRRVPEWDEHCRKVMSL